MTIPYWLAKTIAWCGVALMWLAIINVMLKSFGVGPAGLWISAPSFVG